MNYERLEKNITDNIKEAQIKLGFENRPMSFNYMLGSLNHLIGENLDTDSMKTALEDFAVNSRERLGETTFRPIKDGFCITVSAEGTAYVNSLDGFEFIDEFVNTVRKHGISFDDVMSVFRKYSDNVVAEKKENGEFDYLVYFADGNPDEYLYCIAMEEEIDGHIHITYHRFIREDYEDFSF